MNDFGIYDFANYIITGADADGVEENIQLAIPKIHKTYYLLISKISDPNGLYLDFRVNLNLPNSGIFACVTDSKKKLLEEKIAIKIREKFASNNNIQMGVNSAIVVGILQFINSVNLLKAGICCDYSKDDILSLMKSNGFMQIPGTAHLLPGGLGITPRSGGIIGAIPFTFSAGGATLNLVSNLNKEINFLLQLTKLVLAIYHKTLTYVMANLI